MAEREAGEVGPALVVWMVLAKAKTRSSKLLVVLQRHLDRHRLAVAAHRGNVQGTLVDGPPAPVEVGHEGRDAPLEVEVDLPGLARLALVDEGGLSARR